MVLSPFKAGALRHVVKIQSPSRTKGVDGENVITWGDLISGVYCSISPVGGSEGRYNQATRAETTHLVECRYLGITIGPESRIIFGSRVFNITAPPRLVDEIQHRTIIECIEVYGISTTAGTFMASSHFERSTALLDFTTTNVVTLSVPSGFHASLRSVQVMVTQMDGVVSTQPAISVGITGSTTLYLNAFQLTALSADESNQERTQLDSGLNSTTDFVITLTAGSLASGTVYKGVVVLKGVYVR